MQELNTSTAIPTNAIKAEALASMSASFERFCLAAGLEALAEMMEQDALASRSGKGRSLAFCVRTEIDRERALWVDSGLSRGNTWLVRSGALPVALEPISGPFVAPGSFCPRLAILHQRPT